MMETRIYVPLVGQFENIGDVVLRRELVDWLRGSGLLNVYVGDSSDAYDKALSLPDDATTYRRVGGWVRALISDLLHRRRVAYIYKPGEIQLTWRGLKEHIGLLPFIALVRLSGGFVGRIGAGSRNFEPLPTAIFRSTLPLSNLTVWRDTVTRERLHRGDLMPDLGFGQDRSAADEYRDRLTVTMRGDRERPDAAWIEGVSRAANHLKLRLTVVTQVERDDDLSHELARAWRCDLVSWDARDHAAQEAAVRDVLHQSALVVSDRLHALIVAVTEGSTVMSVAPSATDKIARHFAAAGVPIRVHNATGLSSAEIASGIVESMMDGSIQQQALLAAKVRLADVRSQLLAGVRGSL